MRNVVYTVVISVMATCFCLAADASTSPKPSPETTAAAVASGSVPRQPPYSFADHGNEAVIPFKLAAAGNIQIPVTVNGHLLHFILDSGNVDSLSRQAAKAAGIRATRTLKGPGGGSKMVSIGLTEVKSLTISDQLTLRDQNFFIVPLPQVSAKNPLDGTLGYGILKHFVVRIDYTNHTVTFMRPAGFHPTDAGTPVPLTFYGNKLPIAAGSIDGLAGHFFVDTGAGSFSLSLSAPFAQAHDLYTRYHATPAIVTGVSTGGVLHSRIARGGTFKMGGVSVQNPIILLGLNQSGLMASKEINGDIGGRILRRFTVTFDYPGRRMYLKPNSNYGEPMNYQRAGMTFIKETNQGIQIAGVMPDGPAAEAGIKVGDVITAVDGKPANRISLVALENRLRSEAPGTRVMFTVLGARKAAQTVTVTLRRLIPETGGLS